MRPLPRPAIFMVTSGTVRQKDVAASIELCGLVRRAANAGVDVVQVREPQLSDDELFRVVRRVVGDVDRSRTSILVNDRPDVALAAGADGVHLRADGMPASRIRAMVPGAFLIGRSVHSIAEARGAEEDGGIDYLFFGTVFASAGKPANHSTQGIARLAEVCASVAVPVIAIGGMTAEPAAQAATAGAAGIAAIGMFVTADRERPGGIAAVVREIRDAFH
jgi:thiamine-phosphate diphosphorylase